MDPAEEKRSGENSGCDGVALDLRAYQPAPSHARPAIATSTTVPIRSRLAVRWVGRGGIGAYVSTFLAEWDAEVDR